MDASPPEIGTYQSPDGLALSYRAYGPQDAPPVICLPGLTRNGRDFAPIASHLSRDLRLYCLDFRGRGKSAYDPDPHRYTQPTYSADVRAFLDHRGLAKAAFIGTSLGGMVTMLMEWETPGTVSAAVLNDIGPELNGDAIARIMAYVGAAEPAASWDEAAARSKAVHGVAFPGNSDADWRAFAERTWKEERAGRIVPDYDPAIAVPFETAPTPDPEVLWAMFDALKAVPTLLVHGRLSDLLPEDAVARLKAHRPDMDVLPVAGVGHAPMLTEPGVGEHVLKFLKTNAG
ncbi:MAG: alpha/beta hydrolase [Pseudomonadota bacterium]